MLRVSIPIAWLDELHPVLQDLVSDKVASRIAEKDYTLWGEAAESESKIRLGWVESALITREILPQLEELAAQLSRINVSRIVLCGMGGSSLAPEVITKKFGNALEILDSTSPDQIRAVLAEGVESTAVVVSSKSGSTVETDSQKRLFEDAFDKAGIDKKQRIVIVTDPGSPMDQAARADGYQVINADPNVGGRYSALTAFGVVPSRLAGVNVTQLLSQAAEVTSLLADDSVENPALILGAVLARLSSPTGFKDKVGIISDGATLPGFADWAEQLIAESTGKNQKGILPIALTSDSSELTAGFDDVVLISVSENENFNSPTPAKVIGKLAEQFLLWEYATAVASRLIQVNPFDQPDVESAKVAARSMLSAKETVSEPEIATDGISLSSLGFEIESTDNLKSLLAKLLSMIPQNGYLAIHGYLNRKQPLPVEKLRNILVKKTNRPVTYGWGPRFLHSTGQYHKGGPQNGVFLQLINDSEVDVDVPTRDFTFGKLIRAQAQGDAKVLADLGRPVLRVGFTDPNKDFLRLLELLEEL